METEKRLIDANALEEHIADCFGHPAVDILHEVATFPTVDAVEVVHGSWIELPSMAPEYECSECGQSYELWEVSEAHYCPNCGAKMDGDADG